jgi:hypothetical protein
LEFEKRAGDKAEALECYNSFTGTVFVVFENQEDIIIMLDK